MGKIKFRYDLAQSMTDASGKAMVEDLRTRAEGELDAAVQEWMKAINMADDVDVSVRNELFAAKAAVLETLARLTMTAQRNFGVGHALNPGKSKKSG